MVFSKDLSRFLAAASGFVLSFTLLLAAGIPSLTQADGEYGISPAAEIQAGPQMSWIQCPCFRWVVQADVGGKIETRDLLVSFESVLKFRQEDSADFHELATRLLTVGASEALWKSGHLGLGFTGVTWGENRDLGYSQFLHAGLYGLINAILAKAFKMDFHVGYDYESFKANNGPLINRQQLMEGVAIRWGSKKGVSGTILGHIGEDSRHMLDPHYLTAGVSSSVRGRLINVHGVEMGLGLNLGYEHDGLRNFMGLDPNLMTGTLTMDLSYVSDKDTLP